MAGINLYSDFVGETSTVGRVADHIEHFLELGGEKNIAIGADFDGCERLPENVHGVQDMVKLYNELVRRGLDEHTLNNIFFADLMRMVSF